MPGDLVVDYLLTADDWAFFAGFTCARSRYHQKSLFICAGFVMLLPALMLVAGGPNWGDGLDVFVIDELLIALLFGLLFLGRAPIYRMWTKWRFRDESLAPYMGPAHLALSADGIRCSGRTGEAVSPWSAIVDVAAASAGLYLYYSPFSALIVPRSAFGNDGAFRNFAERAIALRHAALGGASAQGRAL